MPDSSKWVFSGSSPLSESYAPLGREDDLRRLRNLVLAKRVVLLYGVSGSGKTSLIEGRGGLLDSLQEKVHTLTLHAGSIWPDEPATTTQAPPSDKGLQSLKALQENIATFAQADAGDDRPRLVILDQLEQCWMRSSKMNMQGEALFRLLRDALALHSRLALLLVAQEEKLAPIEELREYLPGHLEFRQRLTFFSTDTALALIDKLLFDANLDALLAHVAPSLEKDDPAGKPDLRIEGPYRSAQLVLDLIKDSAGSGFMKEWDPLHIQMCGRLLEQCVFPDGSKSEREAKKKGAPVEALHREMNRIKEDRNIEQSYLRCALADAGRHVNLFLTPGTQLRDWFGGRFITRVGLRLRRSQAELADQATRSMWWIALRRWAQFLGISSSSDVEWSPQSDRGKDLYNALESWGILRHPRKADESARDPALWEFAHDRLVVALRRLKEADTAAGEKKKSRAARWVASFVLLALLLQPCGPDETEPSSRSSARGCLAAPAPCDAGICLPCAACPDAATPPDAGATLPDLAPPPPPPPTPPVLSKTGSSKKGRRNPNYCRTMLEYLKSVNRLSDAEAISDNDTCNAAGKFYRWKSQLEYSSPAAGEKNPSSK